MSKPTKVILVHPDDVNLADTKAAAAQYGTTVEQNRYVPRGQVLLVVDGVAQEWKAVPE